jgi:regulator of sigma E protease
MLVGVILLVVLIFGLLVFVHEFGHFIAAKRAGVVVEEFGFGFPPRLVGIPFRGTLYSINLIPLGGFVRMKGESLADTSPGSFGATNFRQKSLILLAGVTMNILTAFIILVGLCATGLPPVIDGQYSSGTPAYSQPKEVMAVSVVPGSPAAAIGIHQGDIILSGDGQRFSNEDELLNFTKAHAGQTVSFVVKHGSTTRTLRPHLRGPHATDGFLGVTPFQTYALRYDLPHAIITAAGITLQLMWATLGAFGGLIAGLVVHQQVSSDVTGPIGIVVLLENIINLGPAFVLIFVASISISLGVINALPLPALDGGRWALALAQRITKRRLSDRTETLVHATGFAALILLMIVVSYFDIKRIGS